MSAQPSFASPYTLIPIGEDTFVFTPAIPVPAFGSFNAPSAFFQPEVEFTFGTPPEVTGNGAEEREPADPNVGWQETKVTPADIDGHNRPTDVTDTGTTDEPACEFPPPHTEPKPFPEDYDSACPDFPAPRSYETDTDGVLACKDFPLPVFADAVIG